MPNDQVFSKCQLVKKREILDEDLLIGREGKRILYVIDKRRDGFVFPQTANWKPIRNGREVLERATGIRLQKKQSACPFNSFQAGQQQSEICFSTTIAESSVFNRTYD